MTKAGYRKIGQGGDSMVYARDAGHVIKIIMPGSGEYSEADKTFMAWYDFCQQHAGNPYLPKFIKINGQHHSTFEIDGETFRQIAMEKLQRISEWSELLETVMTIIENIEYNQQDKFDPKYQAFYNTVKLVVDTGRQIGLNNDLEAVDNVMQRKDGTPVIIDPWCT
jgi:hypothetical protein